MTAFEPIEVHFFKIPITGLPEMACVIPVTEDGRVFDADGEPLPLEQRTRPCGQDGTWMIGQAFTCAEHWPDACRMGGWDHREIEAEWRSQL